MDSVLVRSLVEGSISSSVHLRPVLTDQRAGAVSMCLVLLLLLGWVTSKISANSKNSRPLQK